jgi:hypothetical protein
MRTRWRTLFACALLSLIGVAWLAQRFDASWSSWLNVQLAGQIGACLIGLLGAVTNTRARWPAALALICAAPMAHAMLIAGASIPELIRYTGAAGVLMVGGSCATVAVAIFVLVSAPPPIPVERIPPARAT